MKGGGEVMFLVERETCIRFGNMAFIELKLTSLCRESESCVDFHSTLWGRR